MFHYGEMINKPGVCRRPVSENNDEQHRLKRDELEGIATKVITPLFPGKIRMEGEVHTDIAEESDARGTQPASITSSRPASSQKPPQLQRGRNNGILAQDEEQLAFDLSKEDLTAKERRILFQKIKAIPLDRQGMIIERSKGLKQ